MAGGRQRRGSGRRGGPRQHPGTHEPSPLPTPLSPTAATAAMAQRNRGAAPKTSHPKKPVEEPAAKGPDVDSLGFQAMDRNVPGLSHVILQKLNMKSYEDYKSAMDGRKSGSDFGIRTYFDMFQKMEDTFKFCAECKKLPDALPDPKSLRRCKRCQNVYYCGLACQRANWPLHKKFCKKLKLVALDRLVEWLIFTGDIPFPTETWTKPTRDVKGWEDWFSMQGQLEEKLGTILAGRYMTLLWANAGKPRPEDEELRESVRRLVTDFHSRPLTIGLGLRLFGFHACPDLLAGWLPTLLLLRDYRLPVLFTVYSEQELKSSLQILVELETHIIGYAANPFASLRPEQVYSSPNKAPVYCSSYYIALLGPAASAVPGAEELEGGEGWQGGEPSATSAAGDIVPGLG
ncbi:putative protein MSS51 homolog, mitochondrial isoform X4 [Phalacrocorax aristotelis]|uniref:putative protein MSS51 homolog, mitochondrial isoform X4 n=1 Tax=Phalacrocorax aristotelis TaxID=126867 RepID=UPI003F4BC3E0